MISCIAPDDLVLGIFANIPKNISMGWYRKRLEAHEYLWQQTQKYPFLREYFTFRNSGIVHESRELDQAISNLVATDTINHGGHWGDFSIPQNLRDVWENELRGSFSREQKEAFVEIAQGLAKLLKVD